MDYYQFIIATIKKAGEMLLTDYGESHKSWVKEGDPRNIVTEVDLRINNFLTEEIKNNYPGQTIYSEEIMDMVTNAELLWTLDPIDGTANFTRRIPHFAISMGLLENGVPSVGAIYNPVTNELFSFKEGEGAFLNNEPIRVSAISDASLAGVLMITGKKTDEIRDWGAGVYRKLLGTVNKTRVLGSSALDLCFLADGRVEGVIYGELTTLDVAPAIGILHEAGGKITDVVGKDIELAGTPQKIIASNGTGIHQVLLGEII